MAKKYSGLYRQNIAEGNVQNIKLLNTFLGIVEEYTSISSKHLDRDLLEYVRLIGQFEVESDEPEERDSVKVMTAHQSKGKQFPAVFVLDLAKNRFPSSYREKKFRVPP